MSWHQNKKNWSSTKGPHDKIHRSTTQTSLGGNSKTWEPRATSKTRCEFVAETRWVKNWWVVVWKVRARASSFEENIKNTSKTPKIWANQVHFLKLIGDFNHFQMMNSKFPLIFTSPPPNPPSKFSPWAINITKKKRGFRTPVHWLGPSKLLH